MRNIMSVVVLATMLSGCSGAFSCTTKPVTQSADAGVSLTLTTPEVVTTPAVSTTGVLANGETEMATTPHAGEGEGVAPVAPVVAP